ncbi:MAG: hypothetical protein IJK59_10915, partial [Firmicutes bacterium]|nr:hypothetical protein [Bacillota bacterium]
RGLAKMSEQNMLNADLTQELKTGQPVIKAEEPKVSDVHKKDVQINGPMAGEQPKPQVPIA